MQQQVSPQKSCQISDFQKVLGSAQPVNGCRGGSEPQSLLRPRFDMAALHKPVPAHAATAA